jgi:N-acetylneuraminic acid mutarotase
VLGQQRQRHGQRLGHDCHRHLQPELSATDIWTWVRRLRLRECHRRLWHQGHGGGEQYARCAPATIAWTDAAGNFWLFGGNSVGNVGMLNDLWEYGAADNGQWVRGKAALTCWAPQPLRYARAPGCRQHPGAREGAASWTDAAGNLWLFGGDSLAAQDWEEFNDLWSYNPTTGLWTWVGGSKAAANAGSYGTAGVPAAGNLPPARTDAISWVDSAGIFWLFGGAQLNTDGSYRAILNDLWSYNPTTGLWTWVGGSSTPNAAGVYGTQGTAAAGNVPGARLGGSTWLDASGNVWLFGGLGPDQAGVAQEYNDLWEYNPGSNQWTWVGGSNTPNAAGVYGTQQRECRGQRPGARVSAVSWTDHAGNFWLFGGYGYAQAGGLGNLNDLWEYNLGTGEWTWIGGSSSTAAYGSTVSRVAAGSDVPGAREEAVGWARHQRQFLAVRRLRLRFIRRASRPE